MMAYRQMLLDEESSELVLINTHQGLYHYIRLSFGVASSPAVFQTAVDSILLGMPHMICFLNDILIIDYRVPLRYSIICDNMQSNRNIIMTTGLINYFIKESINLHERD